MACDQQGNTNLSKLRILSGVLVITFPKYKYLEG